MIEWPTGDAEPTKYWFSTLPEETSLKDLVALAKLRWRIERDDRKLKQEIGLGHYQGRGWRGFHHHASLCAAAYGFLVSERSSLPPTGSRWRPKTPRLPKGWRPRGAPDPPRTAPPLVDRNAAKMAQRRPRYTPAPLPVLPSTQPHGSAGYQPFVT